MLMPLHGKMLKKKKNKIEKQVNKVAKKINKSIGKVKPDFKPKFYFSIMRMMHKNLNDWNIIDRDYWKNQNWFAGPRPWNLKNYNK